MSLQESIEFKLRETTEPLYLEVVNESSMHNVPENSETHFKILVVSKFFENMSRLERQQKVFEILKEEMASGIHALSQRVLTPGEWKPQNFSSPPCMGKGQGKPS